MDRHIRQSLRPGTDPGPLLKNPENSLQSPRSKRLFGWIKQIAMSPFQVKLQQETNAVRPPAIVSYRVDSVRVRD